MHHVSDGGAVEYSISNAKLAQILECANLALSPTASLLVKRTVPMSRAASRFVFFFRPLLRLRTGGEAAKVQWCEIERTLCSSLFFTLLVSLHLPSLAE